MSTFLFIFGQDENGLFSNSEESQVISLPNADCIPRETVVAIDAPRFSKNPSKVVIHRCDGSFDDMTPSLKKCVKNNSKILKLQVQNIFTLQSEVIDLENHTSCQHQCAFDGSQCNKYQNWDSKLCRCTCNNKIEHKCPAHFIWEPNLCQCVCDYRECPSRRQYFDEDECSCTCKPKFFVRCNNKNKMLNESSCKCFVPKSQMVFLECDTIPTKWAVLVIVLSFFAIFIIAFDCILYTRQTGCIYLTTHLCHKDNKKRQDERIPIKDRDSAEITNV